MRRKQRVSVISPVYPNSLNRTSTLSVLLLVFILALQSACSLPAVWKPTPHALDRLGNVAIIAGIAQPEIIFKGFARGQSDSLSRSSTDIFADCLGEMGSGGCSGEFCGAAFILIVGLCTVLSSVGGLIDSADAPTADEVQSSETNLFSVLDAETIQTTLRNAVAAAALDHNSTLFPLSAHANHNTQQKSDYRYLVHNSIDTVMEVSLIKVGLLADGVNGPLLLFMHAEVKLINTRNNDEITSQTFVYEGKRLSLSSWSSEQARRFEVALQTGFKQLASHIYEQTFLLYPFPDGGPHSAGFMAAAFGLAPIYPTIRGQLTGTPILGNRIEWKTVASLRPTLKWQRFPRDSDIRAAAEPMARVKNVRYDLIIARENNLVPGTIIYQQQGLNQNEHTLTMPLRSDNRYFWTVRARFELDGHEYVTEWGVTHYMAFGRMVAPSKWSYRFRTP